MQTKKVSSYEELKKSICKNYLKGVCPFGKECKYRHPPKQRDNIGGPNSKKAGKESEVPVCKYFLQNKCRRGDECPFPHMKPKPEKAKRRSDWLTFCLYFPSGQCKNKDCRFLHVCEDDKDMFRSTGKVDPYVLEQAKCKALLQDVVVNGKAQICKDYLQGHCKWMSCPLLHLTRQEFSQYILDALCEKFASVIGPPEDYQLFSANAYNHSAKLQEPIRYKTFPEPHVHDRRDALPTFKEPLIRDSYIPVKENYAFEGPYGMGYGKKHSWHDRREDYDQNLVSTDADRIVKGIYNLMREDGNLIRNAEKQEIFDLRGKLNSLAEENARYRYEFSTLRPHEGERYKPPAQTRPDQYGFKYQDVVRKLEKENAEMKRQLLMFREMEHEPSYYMEKPEPLFFGSHSNQQEHRRGGSIRGQSHPLYDMRGGEERRWFGSNAYGGHAPMAGHVHHPYNPLKQKVNNQLWNNMAYQYKKPQQMNQGDYQYNRGNNPKYQKPNQHVNRKTQQQNQKTQKSNPKVNQKKKPEETKSPNQAKSVKPKTVNKESLGKEDNEPKVEAEDDSSEETHSDKEDNNDRPQENDARISEAGTLEDENESTVTEEEVTGGDGNQDQENSSEDGNQDQENSSEDGNQDQENSSEDGNQDQEKNSEDGNQNQENNSEDGNQNQENNSEDGNQNQENNSEDGNQSQRCNSAKEDVGKRVEMTRTETENEEKTHGEDEKVKNKTDAKENKSSEKENEEETYGEDEKVKSKTDVKEKKSSEKENKEETHGEDEKVKNKTDAKENKSSEKENGEDEKVKSKTDAKENKSSEKENEEETHGEDKKVKNKTDAKENKSSEKDCDQVAKVDKSE